MAAAAPQVAPVPAGGELNWPQTGPAFDANSNVVSAAGAAVSITYNAPAAAGFNDSTNRRNIISQVFFGYDADPAAGSTLIIKDGSTTVFSLPVTKSGPQSITFNPPKCITANAALVITLSAPGGSILGYLNATVYTEL